MPDIAIINPDILACIGLRTIIEDLFPDASIHTFQSFEAFVDDVPELYAHSFVASRIFAEHASFFRQHVKHPILLTCGDTMPVSGIPTLNTSTSEKELIKSVISLQHHGHHSTSSPTPANNRAELSPREIEVLSLIARGFINKDIADRLNIALTTVISHRKNIQDKLQTKSISGLTIYALLNNYVDIRDI